MPEDQESESALAVAHDACQRIKINLPERLTSVPPSEFRYLAFKASYTKEALLYRAVELAETAIDLYRRNTLVSAATLTRSLLETTSLLERLRDICAKFVNKHKKHGCRADDIEELHEKLQKISSGTTDELFKDEGMPAIEPFKVLSLIRSLGTRYRFDAEAEYRFLCQIVHPNFHGCLGSFAKLCKSHVEFIQDYHHMQEIVPHHTRLLAILLCYIEEIETHMALLLPEFTTVCEKYDVE